MSFIKNITEGLMSGNLFMAKKSFNNLIMEAVPELKPSLRDVKDMLSGNPKDIVDGFIKSNEGQSVLGYTGKDINVGIDHFVKYISDETGVHPNMFKNWNSLKDLVSFYNKNIASIIELPAISDPKQYWTHFQMDVIPSDDVSDQDHVMPNTGMGAVTQGQRDNFIGNGGDSDSIGNISPDAKDSLSKAELNTHVSNRDIGADTDLTKDIDHTDAEGVKRAQNVGVTNADREKSREEARIARDAKYGSAGIENVRGTKVPGARSFSSRQNDGGGRPKKNNTKDESNWAAKYNALMLSKKLPAGVKNPSDLKDWFEKNSK